MKYLLFLIAIIPNMANAQFDFYGPEPFGEILDNRYTQTWNPKALPSIENKKYIVIFFASNPTGC